MRILIVEDETAAYENLADMLVTIEAHPINQGENSLIL